jgi:hypothetical protein
MCTTLAGEDNAAPTFNLGDGAVSKLDGVDDLGVELDKISLDLFMWLVAPVSRTHQSWWFLSVEPRSVKTFCSSMWMWRHCAVVEVGYDVDGRLMMTSWASR